MSADLVLEELLSSMAASSGNVLQPEEVKQLSEVPAIEKRPREADSAIWNPTVVQEQSCISSSECALNPTGASFGVYPLLEIRRQQAVRALRGKLLQLVQNLGLSDLPNTVYENWQFVSKLTTKHIDPLIPGKESDYSCLRDDLEKHGVSRKAAHAICRNITKEAGRLCRDIRRHSDKGATKKKPKVQMEENYYIVSYHGIDLRIRKEHFEKLRTLFNLDLNSTGSHKNQFNEFLFSLLLRYDSLDGGGFQAALNEECFDVLLNAFDCKMECFASPLNCRYGRFCSAFLDTDSVFGSVGSFFDFHPKSGCFEANPPFVPELILKMSHHMTKLLSSSIEPLSFIIIIPTWKSAEGWNILKDSNFNKDYMEISQKDHGYCEGKQHLRPTRWRIASFDTSIFFWQNSAAEKKWKVTEDIKEKILHAFQSKQAQERIDSGLRLGGSRVRVAKIDNSTEKPSSKNIASENTGKKRRSQDDVRSMGMKKLQKKRNR